MQGCARELDDLLTAAAFDPERHQLAMAGDLINRGPDSLGVLERARGLSAWVVLGNHEDALLCGKESDSMDRVRAQLGSALGAWMEWIAELPLLLRAPGLIVVHAGIAPGKRPEACTRTELTRIREVDGRPWFDSRQGPETVVFGHWSLLGRVDRPLVKGLDTGCVYGGRLTGLWWPELRWVSVPAQHAWYDPKKKKMSW